jgi:AcrR family transcriptional regulator
MESNVSPSETPVEKSTRNADRTRTQILDAAALEFAQAGLAGARIEKIAERAGTNKRMLYYYFNNKDDLFVAVLERVYGAVREAEEKLELGLQSPIDAIRSLVTFTWNYYLDHPEFIGLLNTENAHGGVHVQRAENFTTLNQPLLKVLREVIHRGQQEGVFRTGVDVVQLYISIAGLSYFYLSNQHTLGAMFSRDLSTTKSKVERLHHMLDVVLGYLIVG